MLVFVCYSLPPEQLILAEGQANTIQGRSKIYFSQMAYPANPGYTGCIQDTLHPESNCL